jgi:hypothetical protein
MNPNTAELPHWKTNPTVHWRPILSLGSHSIEAFDAREPTRVMLSVGNIGHGSAVKIYYGIECLLVDRQQNFRDEILHALCEMRLRPGKPQLGPGEYLDLHFSLRHLHRTHSMAIKRGERLLLILVRMEYHDLDGNFHWSHVCLQYDGRAITVREEINDSGAAAPDKLLETDDSLSRGQCIVTAKS